MSAIALHDLRDIEPVEVSRSPRRNHLRLVTPGELAPSEATPSMGRGEALRLTRRGRLAITLAAATVLVLTLAAALGMFPAAASGGHNVVVQPGQTLSHLAVTELPELPMDRAIVAIQVANDLNSLDVQAGTELTIPRP